jgi:hypothetical protein
MTPVEAYKIIKRRLIRRTRITQAAKYDNNFYIFNVFNPDNPSPRTTDSWFAVNTKTEDIVRYYPFSDLENFSNAINNNSIDVQALERSLTYDERH